MDKQYSYEQAFIRLEEILHQLNEGKASLEESLKLFEEANTLITHCNQKLLSAEKKIETLIKQRDGSLALDEEGSPLTQEFATPSESLFTE